MSTLFRRLCTRLDTFYERHPLLAILASTVVCFACEVALT